MWRRISTFLLLIVLVPVGTIYRQNIEAWSAKNGLDKLASEGSDILSTNPWGPWVLALFLVLLGSTGGLWIDYFLKQNFPKKFPKKLVEIEGRTFRLERVIIDGKAFRNCVFDSVELVYQGTGFYGFERVSFFGEVSILVESQAAREALNLQGLAAVWRIPIRS